MQIDIENMEWFDKKDVLVQYFKASGPGGQHRNKVETAVRLIHSPTGIVVVATESRSQLQNKKRAWEKLELAFKRFEQQSVSKFDFDKWYEQVEIERGNPVKIFNSPKFVERR